MPEEDDNDSLIGVGGGELENDPLMEEEIDDLDEVGDSFPTTTELSQQQQQQPPLVLLDRNDLARIARERRPGPPSVATTELASAIGSVMGVPRDAFLKSITFFAPSKRSSNGNDNSNNDDTEQPPPPSPQDLDWGITFGEATKPVTLNKGSSSLRRLAFWQRHKTRFFVESISGCFVHSKLHEGDYLKTINGEKITSNSVHTTQTLLDHMHSRLEQDGYLSVAVENPEGSDILIQATIMKPRPDMTYDEMGMIVWYWGYLCIKSISKHSVFRHTVLRDTDHITQINDIDCENMTPQAFAQALNTLEHEVTITVLRRKQRTTGKFG